MTESKKALVVVVSNWVNTLVHYVIAFISTPIIVHSLGNSKYGIWSLAISVTGYYGILDFGIRSAITKYFAQFSAADESKKCNQLISTYIVLYFFISIIIFLIATIIAIYSTDLFKIDENFKPEIFAVVMITGGNLSLSFVFKTFSAVIVALRRSEIISFFEGFFGIIRTVIIIALLKSGFSLIEMAWVVLICDLMTNVSLLVYAYRLFPDLKVNKNNFSKGMIKETLAFAYHNFIFHMSTIVTARLDQILIGVLLKVDLIVYYAIAESLLSYIGKMPKGIITAILPFASYFNSKSNKKMLEFLTYIVTKYMLTIMLFGLFGCFEFGSQVIYFWMGEGFEESWLILLILMISSVITQTYSVLGRTLAGIGIVKEFSTISICDVVLNLLFSVILIKIYGLIGVASATLLSTFITRVIILPNLIGSKDFFSFVKFLQRTIVPSIISFSIFLVLYYLMKFFWDFKYSSITNLIYYILLSTLLFALISKFFVFKEISYKKKIIINF